MRQPKYYWTCSQKQGIFCPSLIHVHNSGTVTNKKQKTIYSVKKQTTLLLHNIYWTENVGSIEMPLGNLQYMNILYKENLTRIVPNSYMTSTLCLFYFAARDKYLREFLYAY